MFIDGNEMFLTFDLLKRFFPKINDKLKFAIRIYVCENHTDKIGVQFVKEESPNSIPVTNAPGIGFCAKLPILLGRKKFHYNTVCDVMNYRFIATRRAERK